MRSAAESEQNGMENNLLLGARNFTTRRLAKEQNGNLERKCCLSICNQLIRHFDLPERAIKCLQTCQGAEKKGCAEICGKLDPDGDIFPKGQRQCKLNCDFARLDNGRFCIDENEVEKVLLEGMI